MLAWIDVTQERLREAGAAVSEAHGAALTIQLQRLRIMYEVQPKTPTRRRRGLINLIGDTSSYLFGTATTKQVDAVRQQISLAERREEVLYHNQEKLVSVLNATRLQSINNHKDIRGLAANISQLMEKGTLLAWGVAKLNVLHQFLHLINGLEQISLVIQLRRRSHLAVCEAMRSGHLLRDVVSDDRLSEVLQVLSHL